MRHSVTAWVEFQNAKRIKNLKVDKEMKIKATKLGGGGGVNDLARYLQFLRLFFQIKMDRVKKDLEKERKRKREKR